MSAWLQKPWVSALLALMATGIIYINVVKPFFLSSSNVRIESGIDSMLMLSPPTQDVRNTAVDWDKVKKATLTHAMHNPFQPYHAPVSRTHHAGTNASLHRKESELHLRAIVIGPALRHALINERIMHVGEKINGMKIIQIDESSVDFAGKGKHIHLQLDYSNKGDR